MPNGRCRMHGGRSSGAPKRNKNALKHGRYTAEAIAQRRGFQANYAPQSAPAVREPGTHLDPLPAGVGNAQNRRIKTMQSRLPVHCSPRCGARTRSGSLCRSPAMPNGRGGLSPGAPKGAIQARRAVTGNSEGTVEAAPGNRCKTGGAAAGNSAITARATPGDTPSGIGFATRIATERLMTSADPGVRAGLSGSKMSNKIGRNDTEGYGSVRRIEDC